MKNAVASDAVATPKLIDICCIVLAMVLALLVCSSVTSAYASVFMLVYWREVKKPKTNAWTMMSHTGVPTPMVANRTMSRPRIRVLEINTRQYPKRLRMPGIVILRLMAAKRLGHHEEAGLYRRKPEAHLVKER